MSTLYTLVALAALTVVAGCSPKIGDKCTVSTDCSATGDRLCDITQPDGYCTIFNCEPDSCPDDAACINFGTNLSPVAGCTVSQGESPYQRSFCLASCESDSDCRADYKCIEPELIGGRKADMYRSNKVCAVYEPTREAPDGSNQVCLGSDAGPAPDMGSGGSAASDAGADGQSSGGVSGAGTDEAGAGG